MLRQRFHEHKPLTGPAGIPPAGRRSRGVFALVLLGLSVPGCMCGQAINPRCDDELACKLESSAESLFEDDPAALRKSTLLLVDSMWRQPSLRAAVRLRANLQLLRRPERTIDQDAAVRVVATSDNGRWVATGSENGTVTLFEASTWGTTEEKGWSKAGSWLHLGPVVIIVFSPDGTRVLSGSTDGTAYVVETATSSRIRTLPQQRDAVRDAAFVPGNKLITGNLRGTLQVFDLSKDSSPMVSNLNAGPFRCIRFSPDGQWVATCGDHSLAVWQVEKAPSTPPRNFMSRSNVNAVAFDHDSRWIVTGNEDGSVHVYDWHGDLARRLELFGVRLAQARITDVAFSSDGRWVAAASSDKTARILNSYTGEELARITHQQQVNSVVFDATSRFLLTGSADWTAQVFRVVGDAEKFRRRKAEISTAAFNPERKIVAVASHPHDVTLFDMEMGEERQLPHVREVTAMSFDDHGDFLVTGDIVSLTYAFATGAQNAHAPGSLTHNAETAPRSSADSPWIAAVAISHDSKFLVIESSDGTIKTREGLGNGRDLFRPLTKYHNVQALALSNDSARLALVADQTVHVHEASAHGRGKIKQWDEQTVPNAMVCRESNVRLTFNHAGTLLATGSSAPDGSAGEIRIHNVRDGSISVEKRYEGAAVQAIAFSSDGKLFAVGTNDGRIHLIDVAAREEIDQIATHEENLREIAFRDNDRSLWTLATGASDLVEQFVSVQEFPANVDALIRQACLRLSQYPVTKQSPGHAQEEPHHNTCEELRR